METMTMDENTTDIVPWKYCNPFANNRSPERLFLFQGESIFIHQQLDEKIELDGNTGNVVWDGAYLMAKYLEANMKDFDGKSCLELGAGTGLVSIVAWLMNANVVATDLPGKFAKHLLKNTSANVVRISRGNASATANDGTLAIWRDCSKLQVTGLSWEDTDDNATVKSLGHISYIFCSEILYLPKFHRALLKTLTKYASKDTVVVLLWKRRGLGEERFFDLACRPSSGWAVTYFSSAVLDPEFQDQAYSLAHLYRTTTA